MVGGGHEIAEPDASRDLRASAHQMLGLAERGDPAATVCLACGTACLDASGMGVPGGLCTDRARHGDDPTGGGRRR